MQYLHNPIVLIANAGHKSILIHLGGKKNVLEEHQDTGRLKYYLSHALLTLSGQMKCPSNTGHVTLVMSDQIKPNQIKLVFMGV